MHFGSIDRDTKAARVYSILTSSRSDRPLEKGLGGVR